MATFRAKASVLRRGIKYFVESKEFFDQRLHGILFIEEPKDSIIDEIGTKEVAHNSILGGATANELRKYVTDNPGIEVFVEPFVEVLNCISEIPVVERTGLVDRKGMSQMLGSLFMALSDWPEVAG